MATRAKLHLDSLKFISLVDVPAQETAAIRLIKRAPNAAAPDEIGLTATAKIMKVGAGADPLIWCWAFTLTDEAGQPYHDLQGDAIQDDYIKAAEEFFASGAAADEMHNEKTTGRIAFGMPMDPDIAKAFFGETIGEQIKVAGLMIAVRASKEALEMVRTGDYTGVSISGTGTRELLKAAAAKVAAAPVPVVAPSAAAAQKGKKKKPGQMAPAAMPSSYKRVGKMAALTSIEDGHQHSIDLDDPADCWRDMLMTSYQTSEGATESHCHAWVYDGTTGKIMVALDSGHTHTVESVVPQSVIAEAAADEEEDANEYVPCCPEPEKTPTVTIQVAARAPEPAANSTPDPGDPTVTTKEHTEMDKDLQIASLRKMLTAALALTEPQRLHVAKLGPPAAESFLQLEPAAMETAVSAAVAADPEVFKTADGTSIRKSHGPIVEKMARDMDALTKRNAEQAEAITKAAEQVANAEVEKRAAAELSHFGKSLGVRSLIMKGVLAIADEAKRTEALEALKGANAALALLGSPVGGGDDQGPREDDPALQLDALAKQYATDHKVDFAKAYDAVLTTPAGEALYAQASKRTLRAV